jgi:hypothetical protein
MTAPPAARARGSARARVREPSWSALLNEPAVVLTKHRELACLTPHCGVPHVGRIHRDSKLSQD